LALLRSLAIPAAYLTWSGSRWFSVARGDLLHQDVQYYVDGSLPDVVGRCPLKLVADDDGKLRVIASGWDSSEFTNVGPYDCALVHSFALADDYVPWNRYCVKGHVTEPVQSLPQCFPPYCDGSCSAAL